MKNLSGYIIRLMLVGFMAAIVFGGGQAKADFTFGEPINMPAQIDSTSWDDDMCVSACGRFLFFGSTRPGGQGEYDIWVASRASVDEDWGTPVNLGATVNSPYRETDPSISVDLLSLFFISNRPGGSGGQDLYVTTRATQEDPWNEPVNLGQIVNSAGNDSDPSISADGLSLYFSTWRGPRPGGLGGDDVWVTTRKTTDDAWGEPVNLGPPINTAYDDYMPCISSDGLALFFNSTRSGGFTSPDISDIYVSTRPSTNAPWRQPVNLGPLINTAIGGYGAADPVISSDGSTIYFGAPDRRVGDKSYDFWQAPIIPIIDFNSDGIVDSLDMCVMVDHWGTDNSICDISPMPWGDGIVDVEDLKVLAEHLFEEVEDLTLIAHWPLDETQGVIAYDNSSSFDGTLIGDPMWQPDYGIVDGAILFDGIDDYISTDFVLNPADSAFSVLAWIKGGVPGQVVLSQADGANWLCTTSVEGCLMTELKKDSGRFEGHPLSSEAFITDGNWHRIGFVWDASYRHLYVDGVEVASDSEPLSGLNDAFGGLYIGTGSNCAEGTFFSGLIDDVRIYNRAVLP